MNQTEFLEQLGDNFDKALEIVKSKNQDYATELNPFKNFEMAGLVGIGVPQAILVRVTDKIGRISNLIGRKNAVENETIGDTLLDCMNYLNILKVYLEDK